MTLGVALFVTLYVATGWLGLRLVAVSGFATPVWAPSGLALTALLALGRRTWPAVALGAFVVNVAAGAPAALAVAIAAGNTLEAVLGASLLRRHGFSAQLDRIRDVVLLVGLAAIGSTIVSPSSGVTALWLTGQVAPDAVLATWITWWIGDALGDLVLAPLLLVWLFGGKPRLPPGGRVEALGLLTALAVANAVVFSNMVMGDGNGVFRQAYIVFPILIWAAIRFGQHGTTLTTFLTSSSAIVATSLGLGPFAGGSLSEGLLLLQAFMGVVSVTMLILSAAVNERNRAIGARAQALSAETAARKQAERAEERARFLDRSGRVLSGSLSYRDTLQQMADLAVPSVADFCAVEIVEADGGLTQVALVHRNEAMLALARQLRRRFPPDPALNQGLSRVLETGRAELLSPVSDTDLTELAQNQEHRALLEVLGLKSIIVVPLLARERSLGMIVWATADSDRYYGQADLALAIELSRRAAVAIDNARLFEQAQHAVRAREQFLSIASHELRTPLAALTLQVQSLLRAAQSGLALGDKPAQKLGIIERQVTRLTTLVDNLLDVSRVMGGRMTLELEELDLRPIIEEVLEHFAEQLAKSGCALTLELDPSCVGIWDRFRLEQIMTNLLANAIKYGRGAPIVVGLRSEPERAALMVKDNGIGIAEEDQARIFERFERAVSHRNFGGLGLGLWITKELVVALGGSISLKSMPGQGAEFTVLLPKEPVGEKPSL